MVAVLVGMSTMLRELALLAFGNYLHCVPETCKTDNTDRLKEISLRIHQTPFLNQGIVSVEVQAEREVLS
jgi:hypothetical protein